MTVQREAIRAMATGAVSDAEAARTAASLIIGATFTEAGDIAEYAGRLEAKGRSLTHAAEGIRRALADRVTQ